MPDVIRIKRRQTGAAGPPSSLTNAEVAFNEVDQVLYYGEGGGSGPATSIIPIEGPGAILPLTGGTLTGPLVLAGDPTVPLNPVTLQYLNSHPPSIELNVKSFGATGNGT